MPSAHRDATAEVLVEFDAVVRAADGAGFTARVFAQQERGLWAGWIEFTPLGSGAPIRTAIESEQPNRNDLLYWAEGLTQVYLEGALARALEPR